MSRMRSTSPLARAAFTAAVLLAAQAAHAQQQDAAFRAGLDARQARNWKETAAQMRRAIQGNPKENKRKVGAVLGLGGTEYLPHYFLGEALFNLGDCSGAVEAWSMSEQQGVVRDNSDYFALLRKGYGECEAKGVLSPASFNPLLAKTRQHLTEVSTLAASVSASGRNNIELWNANAALKEQYERASGELQNAQARLATATRTRLERDFSDAVATADRARTMYKAVESQLSAAVTLHATVRDLIGDVERAIQDAEANDRAIDRRKAILTRTLAVTRQAANDTLGRVRSQLVAGQRASSVAALTEARTLALDASAKLKEVLDETARIEKSALERRVAEAVAAGVEAFSFVDGNFATLERLAVEKPSSIQPEMAGERESLQKQTATLRRRFESARKVGDVGALQEATRLATEVRSRLDALIGSFGPVTIVDRGVRPELVEGVRHYLAGNYEQALASLDPARLSDVPLQLHVHLFRAAALYALHIRSGGRDEGQRTQARAEIDRCKQLNPGFQPDARAFGPRFLGFFNDASAPDSQPATPPSRQ